MKQKSILIIDESELFRDYLKDRLAAAGLAVEAAVNGLAGMARMRETVPDLVIMDYSLTRKSCAELLAEKSRDPNAAGIPVVLTAQKIDKNRLLELVPYNIKRVIMKPIKIDDLFSTLSELLGIKLEVETTPCVIEAHVNDNIVFVEIAKGLNRERIDLLRFKIAELLELYQIRRPRILVMLSDMELSFVDGTNLELLLDTMLDQVKAKAKHIKLLTNSSFAGQFVRGQPKFSEIEVVSNLQHAMDGLVADYDPNLEMAEGKAELLAERVLSAQTHEAGREAIDMRSSEAGKPKPGLEALKERGSGLSIAVADDDFVIQELVKTAFGVIGAKVSAFSDGKAFLDAASTSAFDLLFLDILMPGMDGFQVLGSLREREIELPVIVLSAVSQREAVTRAFQAGVKSYLVKPLKPDLILKKTLEILRANF